MTSAHTRSAVAVSTSIIALVGALALSASPAYAAGKITGQGANCYPAACVYTTNQQNGLAGGGVQQEIDGAVINHSSGNENGTLKFFRVKSGKETTVVHTCDVAHLAVGDSSACYTAIDHGGLGNGSYEVDFYRADGNIYDGPVETFSGF